MKVKEFINKLHVVADAKTLYVMGAFGAPLCPANRARYTKNNDYNKQATRTKKINNAQNDVFAFDCCGLIKGVLWGWSADIGKTYGGATYESNGVPDISANGMAREWGVNKDFSDIVPGAFVWLDGHIGVYVGDGLVIESSPKWKDGVQYTGLANIGGVLGYNNRTWTGWGLIPAVDYESVPETKKVDGRMQTIGDIPEWGKDAINAAIKCGAFSDISHLNLDTDLLRVFVVMYRRGIFDVK